jgi:hypothetical protein
MKLTLISKDKKMTDKNMKARSPFLCLPASCHLLLTALLLAPLTALHAAELRFAATLGKPLLLSFK